MKKTLTVLLVLAVAMGGLFATDPTLVLTSTKTGEQKVGFSTAAITTYAATYSAAVESGKEISGSSITGYYMFADTSSKAKYYVKLAATRFQSASTTTDYGYDLTINGVTLSPTASEDVAATTIWQLDNSSGNAPKVETKQFTVFAEDADEKALALEADDYKATLTITIEAAT